MEQCRTIKERKQRKKVLNQLTWETSSSTPTAPTEEKRCPCKVKEQRVGSSQGKTKKVKKKRKKKEKCYKHTLPHIHTHA